MKKGDVTVHTEEPSTESDKGPDKPAKTPPSGWRRHVKPVVIGTIIWMAFVACNIGMETIQSMLSGPAQKAGQVVIQTVNTFVILLLWHWMTRKAEAKSGKRIPVARLLFWVFVGLGGLLIVMPVMPDIVRLVLVHVRR